MKKGMIYQAVREQARSLTVASAVMVLLCLGVLALNWKYVFNWLAGPVPFTTALAASPGAREFVSVKGELVPTGVAQQTVLKLKGKFPLSKAVTAEYMMLRFDGRMLVVKVPPKFAANVVEGRLVPMPAELATSLQAEGDFYPWIISAQTNYRLDFNLFVVVAALLLPFATLLLGLFLWRGSDPVRNPAIKNLERFGPPLEVVEQIEAELASNGQAGTIGPLAITSSWVIVWEPLLKILAVKEIVAIARESRTKKSGTELVLKHYITLWLHDKSMPEEVEVDESTAAAVLQRVTALYPWVVVENAAEFGRKWSRDRSACEQEIAQRKSARVSS